MGAPTNSEQLLLELINDTRLDPLGSANRYITTYTPLVSPIPDVQNAFNGFGVNGAALLVAFQALTPVRPLAWNDALGTSSDAHSQLMINNNAQQHDFPGEADVGQRMINAGYTNLQTAAENIFAFATSELEAHAAFMVDWGGGADGMQNPPGHRNALMNGNFREVGIGIIPDPLPGVGPLVITEHLANRFNIPAVMILGVDYNDVNGDRFYGLGEGVAGLSVAAVGGGATASTASGGYTLGLVAGAQTLTFSAGGLAGPATVTGNFAAGTNAKIDIVSGTLLKTSASINVAGPISQIEALGLTGLTINADAGAQAMIGSKGGDTFSAGADGDSVFGGHWSGALPTGNDTLDGGAGNDGLWGFDGADLLIGGSGNDGLVGGAGNDTLNGGDGNDFLFGGDFSAVDGSRLAGSANDVLNGDAGDDALYGFDGDDLINGDVGNEYVEAGEGNDTVNGGADADTILGQAGNDFLNGGAGFDYLYGGAGADIFSFRRGDSYDTGWDFSVAEGDRLRIDPATGVTNFAQFQALLTGFAFDAGDGRGLVQFSVLNVAALGSNDQITIGGMRPADWTAGIVDFL